MEAVLECLEKNDIAELLEIIEIHLSALYRKALLDGDLKIKSKKPTIKKEVLLNAISKLLSAEVIVDHRK